MIDDIKFIEDNIYNKHDPVKGKIHSGSLVPVSGLRQAILDYRDILKIDKY